LISSGEEAVVNPLVRISVKALCLAMAMAGGSAAAEVVVVVSAQSTVKSLSKSEVADIFLRKTRRFPNGAEATPVDQPEGSPVRDEFYMAFTDRSHAQIKAYWSKIVFTGRGQPPLTVSSAAELKRRIAMTPGTIGYIDRSQLDASVREIR
jgi:ABC-type phosphate transport system substrate-binding protein